MSSKDFHKMRMTQEAQKIFFAIFGGAIPERLAEQFSFVPKHVFPNITDDMRTRYDRILAEVRDLEALELASRVWRQNLLLTVKFRLMVHLAECHPECRLHFVNRAQRALPIFLLLLLVHSLRHAYKFAKGSYLLRRYHGP